MIPKKNNKIYKNTSYFRRSEGEEAVQQKQLHDELNVPLRQSTRDDHQPLFPSTCFSFQA